MYYLKIECPIQSNLSNSLSQIIEIQDRYPKLSPDEAFVVWYLRSYLVDSEDKAIEALRGAPDDKDVDAEESSIISIIKDIKICR